MNEWEEVRKVSHTIDTLGVVGSSPVPPNKKSILSVVPTGCSLFTSNHTRSR